MRPGDIMYTKRCTAISSSRYVAQVHRMLFLAITLFFIIRNSIALLKSFTGWSILYQTLHFCFAFSSFCFQDKLFPLQKLSSFFHVLPCIVHKVQRILAILSSGQNNKPVVVTTNRWINGMTRNVSLPYLLQDSRVGAYFDRYHVILKFPLKNPIRVKTAESERILIDITSVGAYFDRYHVSRSVF